MKKAIGTITGIASSLALALPVYAQAPIDPCPAGQKGGTNFGRLCALDSNSIGTVVSTIVTVLLIAATLIALFFLIWGGIRWITSGGDKGKVEEARKHIIAAIVGLIIAFLAYFILTLVLGFFGLTPRDLRLPSLV